MRAMRTGADADSDTAPPPLGAEECERARRARDARFDGRFFVGVLSTGIYCRPVCPARIPRRENIRIHPSAAAAEAAGFRPCLRCRPESSPGTPAWSGPSWRVSRALQLIDQGFLDDGSVDELAARTGVGARHLNRLFREHLGASPAQVARTRRLHFAKKLLDETDLPLSEVCFASGFGSVRRFNAAFRETYARPPGALRARRAAAPAGDGALRLALSYRPPLDWRRLLAFLSYRAIPGVEAFARDGYARTFSLHGHVGDFRVRFRDGANRAEVAIRYPRPRHLDQIVHRIRSLLDLRADSAEIDRHLSGDPLLGPAVRRFPGLRVPGCWDGFEVAVRAVLGQQVAVKAASTLAARIARRHGAPCRSGHPGLSRVFPDAAALAGADLGGLGIVGQRIAAIQRIGELTLNGALRINGPADADDFMRTALGVKGVGLWTAHYIAMRALGDPDAFPHPDLVLRRAAAPDGGTLTAGELLELAEPWRPWRAYATMLLWQTHQHTRQEMRS